MRVTSPNPPRIKIPSHLLLLFRVYLLGMIIFLLFRILTVLTNLDQVEALPDKFTLLLKAFVMGFRFDTAVSGYLLVLPWLALSTAALLKRSPRLWQVTAIYLFFLYSLTFLICSIDLPYFDHFFTRFTVSGFNWTDPSFVFTMILGEFNFYVYFFVFLFTSFLFAFYLRKFYRKALQQRSAASAPSDWKRWGLELLLSVLVGGLLFLAIRGRVAQKSPLRVGTAYFSNYAFPNQLGLNPAFVFARSLLDAKGPENRRLHLAPEDQALKTVQDYLGVHPAAGYDSPIARQVSPVGAPQKANVILVIMESLSANFMQRYGNTETLTPVLDSLARMSYCFDNFYTDGIHTYNGVYATLFSLPVLLKKHPMKGTVIPELTGFAQTLAPQGYQSIFIMTHDEQFDNIAGFLHAQGFTDVVSQKDYPASKVRSTLGVPDDYMFEFSIPKLNVLAAGGQPFFAAYMTGSLHDPIVIPEEIPFQPRHREPKKAIVEYSDWAIGEFLHLAAQQDWYEHTVFAFVADHGALLGDTPYDLPLSYFHTPFILFAPDLLPAPQAFAQLGSQIDIFPTLMGLLNLEYVNNTLGMDLLRQTRRFVSFSQDNKVGCLSQEFLWIYREGGLESLHRYRTGDPGNYLSQNPTLADSMKTYAFSMLQTAQGVIENHQARPQSSEDSLIVYEER